MEYSNLLPFKKLWNVIKIKNEKYPPTLIKSKGFHIVGAKYAKTSSNNWHYIICSKYQAKQTDILLKIARQCFFSIIIYAPNSRYKC